MDPTNIKELLKLYEEFVRRVRQTAAASRGGTEQTLSSLGVMDKDRVVTQLQQRIESLTAAKQRFAERVDAEIRWQQETIASLGAASSPPSASVDDRPPGPESRTEDRKGRSTKPGKKAGGKT